MLSFDMEFGFDNLFNNGENGGEISRQKWYGFGGEKQVNEDEVRDFKMAKTSSCCSETMLRFYNGSEGHQQMLSFSSPYSQPLNLPYYPHAFARNNNSGGINGQLQQQQQGVRGLFTASQWMELEHQALIYKYITSNVPIPSYLLNPIRKAFESAGYPALRSNALGWGGFQLGFSNTDPEPGRCRRTDGKKWRCSRDAVAEQKYCERHMNRGRHRSRKPVEPQPAAATTTGNGKLAAVASSTSATVVPSVGVSSHLQPTPTNHLSGIPTLKRSFVDKAAVVRCGKDMTDLFPHKHETSASQQSSSSSFGLVCSDSLLNPLNRQSEHPLRQFMDDWPKTHLSISIPTTTTEFMSSSPREELEMGLRVGVGRLPISMGGPLGEVLHSRTGECKPLNLIDSWDNSNSPRQATSPTGVLQRGAFVSLSNSSTASSPRAETGLMNPSLPAL